MTSQINNQQKYIVSCLWFDVGKILFNNLPFVFEVVSSTPRAAKRILAASLAARGTLKVNCCKCFCFVVHTCVCEWILRLQTAQNCQAAQPLTRHDICFHNAKTSMPLGTNNIRITLFLPCLAERHHPVHVFWAIIQLGCYDPSVCVASFVDATIRKEMNASYELTPLFRSSCQP